MQGHPEPECIAGRIHRISKKQLKVLEKNQHLVVWSEGLIIDTHGNFIGELFTQKYDASRKKKSGDIFEELQENYICGQSAIFKKENIEGIRYDERLKYLNGHKSMLGLAGRYDYYSISEPLATYRIHGGNTLFLDKEGEAQKKDRIVIGRYFLRNYGTYVGEKAKVRQYAYHAIKFNPFI